MSLCEDHRPDSAIELSTASAGIVNGVRTVCSPGTLPTESHCESGSLWAQSTQLPDAQQTRSIPEPAGPFVTW